METNTASTDTATTTSTPTYEWLAGLVGQAAVREFDMVFSDWLRECGNKIEPFDTAKIMFAAGYVARRNDELKEKHGE